MTVEKHATKDVILYLFDLIQSIWTNFFTTKLRNSGSKIVNKILNLPLYQTDNRRERIEKMEKSLLQKLSSKTWPMQFAASVERGRQSVLGSSSAWDQESQEWLNRCKHCTLYPPLFSLLLSPSVVSTLLVPGVLGRISRLDSRFFSMFICAIKSQLLVSFPPFPH